jgi:hypothetical protein
MDVSGKHAASVVRVGEGILIIEVRDSSETSIPDVISQKTVILIV